MLRIRIRRIRIISLDLDLCKKLAWIRIRIVFAWIRIRNKVRSGSGSEFFPILDPDLYKMIRIRNTGEGESGTKNVFVLYIKSADYTKMLIVCMHICKGE